MIDEVYIRMCREAVEIQEGWEPRDGDQVSYWMKNYGVIEFTEILHGCGGEVVDEIGHPIKNCQNVVWLPRQEDLQKIYKEQKELSFDCCYVQFKRWDAFRYQHERFEHGLPYFEIFETGDWNILWLCFVMETCYHKQWNMETQTWETTQ